MKVLSVGLVIGGIGWLVYTLGAEGFGIFIFIVAGLVGAFALWMLAETL